MSRESKAYSLLSKTALMERGGPERQSIPKKYARRNTVCVVLWVMWAAAKRPAF